MSQTLVKSYLESPISIEKATQLANYLAANQEEVPLLIHGLIIKDVEANKKAAWCLGKLGEICPQGLQKHQTELLKILSEKGKHNSVYRNIFRVFCFQEPLEKNEGTYLNLAISYFEDITHANAVRAFALKGMTPVLKKHPELIHEIKSIIEWSWDSGSPGVKSISKNTLKFLEPYMKGIK